MILESEFGKLLSGFVFCDSILLEKLTLAHWLSIRSYNSLIISSCFIF